MTITHTPLVSANVGLRMHEYIYNCFDPDREIQDTDCTRVRDHLQQLVQGSSWTIRANPQRNGVLIVLRFFNEQAKLLYTLKWL